MREEQVVEGVKQELYAMFTAHNFVRTTVVETAETHDIQLLQISFTLGSGVSLRCFREWHTTFSRCKSASLA